MMRIFRTVLAASFSMLVAIPAAFSQTSPDVLVKSTIEDVLTIVRADKEIQAGNVNRIAEVMEQKIAPHFDFARMARLAVGRSWRDATPDQRDSLVREFRTLLVRSYSAAFTMYRGIAVEYRPLRRDPASEEVTVNTLIRLPGGAQPISVDYDMLLSGAEWKVFDVRIDGASLVINYRNLFSQEIQRGGIEGLLRSLIEKNSGKVSASAKQ
jgi:phospholipid transport system substrate-binding protein